MEDVRLLSDLPLRRPVLLFAFTGWNDAGEGASGAIRVLAEHWDATQIAEIDPEPFTDFATVRPFVVHRRRPPADRLADGRRVGGVAARRPTCCSSSDRNRRCSGDGSASRSSAWPSTTTCRWRSASARCSPSTRTAGRRISRRRPPTRRCATASACARRATRGRPGSSACSATRSAAGGVPTASLWAAVPTYTAQLAAAKATRRAASAPCARWSAPRSPVTRPRRGDRRLRVASRRPARGRQAGGVRRAASKRRCRRDADDDDAGDELTGELDVDGDSRLVAEVEEFLRNPATAERTFSGHA